MTVSMPTRQVVISHAVVERSSLFGGPLVLCLFAIPMRNPLKLDRKCF
jgi:hypothetical protein